MSVPMSSKMVTGNTTAASPLKPLGGPAGHAFESTSGRAPPGVRNDCTHWTEFAEGGYGIVADWVSVIVPGIDGKPCIAGSAIGAKVVVAVTVT